MVTFWLLSILLILCAIIIMVFPLVRKKPQQENEIDQKQINVDIAREQLDTLKENLDSGEISDEEYNNIKYEIEGSLIDDISDDGTVTAPVGKFNNKLAIIIISVFVPMTSFLLYWQIGTPQAIGMDMQAAAQQNASHTAGQQPSVEQMIDGLLAKLRENPQDEQGWSMLGRTFMAVKRYDEAYQVYAKLLQLKGKEDASVLVSMADALAMANDGTISGEPANLVQRALKVDPVNITALWLAGLAADEQKDFTAAVAYWKRILPLVKDDPNATQQVKEMIAQAEGTPSVAPVSEAKPAVENNKVENQAEKQAGSGAAVKVHVSLDAALSTKVNPDDVVFVFAKATQGPPMPLAAVKKRVRDMPMEVILDDSMAMMPNMKMSNFKQVVISARISKSGSPTGKKGDLMSQKVVVELSNSAPVSLTIANEIQ